MMSYPKCGKTFFDIHTLIDNIEGALKKDNKEKVKNALLVLNRDIKSTLIHTGSKDDDKFIIFERSEKVDVCAVEAVFATKIVFFNEEKLIWVHGTTTLSIFTDKLIKSYLKKEKHSVLCDKHYNYFLQKTSSYLHKFWLSMLYNMEGICLCNKCKNINIQDVNIPCEDKNCPFSKNEEDREDIFCGMQYVNDKKCYGYFKLNSLKYHGRNINGSILTSHNSYE